jgi:hypothetical protein
VGCWELVHSYGEMTEVQRLALPYEMQLVILECSSYLNMKSDIGQHFMEYSAFKQVFDFDHLIPIPD